MNVISNIKVTQIPPIETLVAHILVTFDVTGTKDEDELIQVYANSVSDGDALTPASLKDQVELNRLRNSYESTFDLIAGNVYIIRLCSIIAGDVPDEETCAIYKDPFPAQALQLPSGPRPKPASPVIISIEPHQATLHDDGKLIVRWTSVQVDQFHLTVSKKPKGFTEEEINSPVEDGFWVVIPTFPSEQYSFSVQGCIVN